MTATRTRSRVIPASAALAFALACSSPWVALAEDGPESPVQGLFQAFAEKRFEDAASYFCPEFASQAAQMDLGAAFIGILPANVDPQLAEDALTIAVSGPDGSGEPLVTTGAEDASGTEVDVDALLTAAIDPAHSEGLLRALAEARVESSEGRYQEEDIPAVIADLQSRLESIGTFTLPIRTHLTVTQSEDGAWVICSPLLSASEPEASNDPGATQAA